MCFCGKPNVNGTPGYRWQHDAAPSTRPIDPPTVTADETILYDEPGRCGGFDSHSHHYRVIRSDFGRLELLVRHGGGDERIRLTLRGTEALDALDSTARYWILNAIYHAHRDAASNARIVEADRWTRAAAEKRIKTRKQPARGTVKVWVEDAPARQP
jgi:hypothetical protein